MEEQVVYFIDNQGRIWGTNNYIRLPRKLKKLQKKLGTFEHRKFIGLPLNNLSHQ